MTLIHINAAVAALLGVPAFGAAMTRNERRVGRFLRDFAGHPAGGAGLTPEQIGKQWQDALDAVKKIAETAATEAKSAGTMSAETKAAADMGLLKLNVLDELKTRLDDIEQKHARPAGDGIEVKSYGEQLAASEELKSFVARKASGSMMLELKAISTATGSAGGLILSQRETEIVGIPKRPDIILRDLLTVVPVTTGSIDYPKQTARTNNARAVPEGTSKPYSDYTWGRVTTPVRTLAHLAKLTRQALDDAPRLQAEVDAEMRYGLALAEDQQILLGDGTGENLLGLLPQATPFVLPTGATAPTTAIDKLRAAILQSVLAFYPADGIVLNPIDWYNIEITKDQAGGYILANPMQMTGPTLWGRPVAASVSMTAGQYLVGNFKLAATLYDRMTVEVLISSENADDFEKNLLTMRAEERLALAVKRAAALIKGSF